MTQMTPSAARVIDPILSSVARGYQNNALVGGVLFPTVPVAQRAGKIIVFGKEQFQSFDTARAPGANVSRMKVAYSSSSYGIVDYSLGATVPIEVLEEAQAVPGINLATASVNTVMNVMRLQLEVAQATLATTAGNYASSNKTTLSGHYQWSDQTSASTSVPLLDIEAAKEAVRAKTGKRPNVVVMGPAVLSALRTHPHIVERIKYTGRDVPTTELLASLFGVDQVIVGDAIKATDAGVFSDVWGKFVVVAYTDRSGIADMGRPSYGYTYQLGGYPFVEPARWDPNTRTWVYDVSDAFQPVIAGAEAGYLISAAVA